MENVFPSRSPKNDLKQHFLTFLSCQKTSDLHLIPEDFYKNCIKELCKNNLKINHLIKHFDLINQKSFKLSGILHKHKKGSSLLLKKFLQIKLLSLSETK